MKKKSPKKVKEASFEVATPQSPRFGVSLKLDNTVIEGFGDSVLAALRSLKKPVKITTKSVLTVTRGNLKHLRPLTIPLAKRLFYPASQVYLAKNLELVMK